jgi:hypothetical protein
MSMMITDGICALERPWYGHGVDYQSPDKATYKAITTGQKYFEMKLLHVSVGNPDGEHENMDETGKVSAEVSKKVAEATTEPVDVVKMVKVWGTANLVKKYDIPVSRIAAWVETKGGWEAFINNDPARAQELLAAEFTPKPAQEGEL